MKKKTKSSILTEQIAELTNSVPSYVDDDDYDDGTRATDLLKGVEYDKSLGNGEAHPSALRVAADMEDIGNQYRGEKVSRKDLNLNLAEQSSTGSDSSEGESGEEDTENSTVEGEDQDVISHSNKEVDSDKEIQASSSDEENQSSSEEDEAAEGKNQSQGLYEELAQLEQEDLDSKVQFARFTQQDFKKSAAAKVQKSWWDNFFQIRILLQRLTNVANRLPVEESYPLFVERTDKAMLDQTKQSVESILLHLLKIQRIQQSNHKEIDSSHQETTDISDVDGMWHRVDDNYQKYKAYWEPTLERWHQKTQLSLPGGGLHKKTNKYKVLNQGFWTQVEAVLADKQRGKRKLHPVASEGDAEGAKRLGRGALQSNSVSPKGDSTDSSEESEDSGDDSGNKRQKRLAVDDLDFECFDDIEFYQQQLKEFIANSSGLNLNLSEKLPTRKKKMRKVDQRASKDRKLKFTVHSKLENFKYPQPYENVLMNIDELYSSLFGKKTNH